MDTWEDRPDAFKDGRYRILEPLGAGGMATVYRCHDQALDVHRAIKVRRRMGGPTEATALRRLEDEARVMARLDHPHVLPVFDIGSEGDWTWVVMDLAPGGSLSDRLERDGPMAPAAAVDLVLDLLDALQAAHEAGIVHRDIKPHNILLDAEDRPLLADWGIARIADRDHTLTRTAVGMGSMAFMAPEQRRDAHQVDETADVYAMGATLYHVLTGTTSVDLFHARESSPRWEEVPEVLRPVLTRACALRPADRPPSAAALAEALAEVRPALEGLPAARPVDEAHLDHGTRPASDTATAPPPAPVAEEVVADEAATEPPLLRALVLGGAGLGVVVALIALFFLLPLPWASATTAPTPAQAPSTAVAGLDAPPDDAPPDDAPPDQVGSQPEEVGSQPDEVGSQPDEVAPGAPTSETGAPPDRPTASDPPPTAGASPGLEADPPSRPPDTASTSPSGTVAVLPIHGPWRGSLEGRVVRLTLDGPTDDLAGRVTLGDASGTCTGDYDAGSASLSLEVSGPGPAAGTWSLALSDERARGTVTLAGSRNVVPVTLTRAPMR